MEKHEAEMIVRLIEILAEMPNWKPDKIPGLESYLGARLPMQMVPERRDIEEVVMDVLIKNGVNFSCPECRFGWLAGEPEMHQDACSRRKP